MPKFFYGNDLAIGTVLWGMRVLCPILIFCGCLAIAILMELITGYILEFLIGHWPWRTSARFTFHFVSRIALLPVVFFGLGGVVILYLLQPRL